MRGKNMNKNKENAQADWTGRIRLWKTARYWTSRNANKKKKKKQNYMYKPV